jgi:hypothetical protein
VEKKDAGDPGRDGPELNDRLVFLKGKERDNDGRGVCLGLVDEERLGSVSDGTDTTGSSVSITILGAGFGSNTDFNVGGAGHGGKEQMHFAGK